MMRDGKLIPALGVLARRDTVYHMSSPHGLEALTSIRDRWQQSKGERWSICIVE
jgi:hypothetical protein